LTAFAPAIVNLLPCFLFYWKLLHHILPLINFFKLGSPYFPGLSILILIYS
jgi:hypothetical protein